MKDWMVVLLLALLLWGSLMVAAFSVYSDYLVCKEYYPKINPLTCLFSKKTRVIDR
jgi:hypothetical protein